MAMLEFEDFVFYLNKDFIEKEKDLNCFEFLFFLKFS